ncbi:MAG: bifunctional precorrin-2 dehydrogenase/sirohydrochlorin ferrochelatase [Actinomycetes bacterium]
MAFDYPVTLDLAGRRCLVAGDGPLALDRVEGLVASGAAVELYAAAPAAELAGAVVAHGVAHHARTLAPADLDGAFLAIVTREDDADVAALWDASREARVLFAALDDVPHCDFGAMSTIRRGDLRVTVSTAGRAPALAKRLRRRLETDVDEAYGELVERIDAAKRRVGPRTVPFAAWAARWEEALADLDGLLELVRAGRAPEAEDRIVATIADAGAGPVDDGPVSPDDAG